MSPNLQPIYQIASIDGVAPSQIVQQILDYRNRKVSCLRGSSLRMLHEAFGPELTGHIADCPDCDGKRSMHVSPTWRKCLSCGCYTDLHVIEQASISLLEAPMVEQIDAESTGVPVEQPEVTAKKSKKAEVSGEEPKKVGRPKKGKGRTRMNCSFDLDVAAFLRTQDDYSNFLEEFIKTHPSFAAFLQNQVDGEEEMPEEEDEEPKEPMVQVGVEVVTLSCPACGKGVDAPDGTLLFSAEDWQRLPQLMDCMACGSPIKLPGRSPFRKASKKAKTKV